MTTLYLARLAFVVALVLVTAVLLALAFREKK